MVQDEFNLSSGERDCIDHHPQCKMPSLPTFQRQITLRIELDVAPGGAQIEPHEPGASPVTSPPLLYFTADI